jgi:hypothetical protein
MMERCGHFKCHNPHGFKYYINKGITVCEEWRTLVPFVEWAYANGYRDDLTIDRIDSDKGYEPSNCRWVSMAENLRARKDRKLTMEKARAIRQRRAAGESPSDLAREFGITPNYVAQVVAGDNWAEEGR